MLLVGNHCFVVNIFSGATVVNFLLDSSGSILDCDGHKRNMIMVGAIEKEARHLV